MMQNGRRRNDNGLLSFKAKQGASGSGEIEYTIEDALGQRAKGVITLIISGEMESLVDSRSFARAGCRAVTVTTTNGRQWILMILTGAEAATAPVMSEALVICR